MNDGTTPLILAARLAVEGMVEELIHCHADINAVDDHGQQTFHILYLLLNGILVYESQHIMYTVTWMTKLILLKLQHQYEESY